MARLFAEQMPERCFQIVVAKRIARRFELFGQDAGAGQQEVVRHFPERQTGREGGHGKDCRPAKYLAERFGELAVRDRQRSDEVYGAAK